ncbi:MAG: hypothetical protein JWO86_8894 [Myxococcaceae bacterium]|nr:hypothetical protein [Myxococcaceae bacterium]
MLALAALLGAGCGKTDAIGDRVRRDPRTGPLVSQGGGGASLPVVTPRWDPATVANGFLPVPPVEEHPPFEHR